MNDKVSLPPDMLAIIEHQESQRTGGTLIANLRHAARNHETVTIGGGEFGPAELLAAAQALEALADLHLAVTMRPSGTGGLSSRERIALDRARSALAQVERGAA
jgi:hypothetical protein